MTKSQLIDRISEKTPRVSKGDIETIVHTVFESMQGALRRKQRIEIRGLGSFAVKTREARVGRNPKTGETVHVPRRHIPYFTVGKELRERLNPFQPASSAASSTATTYGSPSLGSSPAAHAFNAASENGPRYPVR